MGLLRRATRPWVAGPRTSTSRKHAAEGTTNPRVQKHGHKRTYAGAHVCELPFRTPGDNDQTPWTFAVPSPATGPIPVIDGGATDVNATTGSNAVLTNNGTSCPRGNCTTLWSMTCPSERGSFANRTGDSVTITIGANNTFDVDAAGATEPFNCEERAGLGT